MISAQSRKYHIVKDRKYSAKGVLNIKYTLQLYVYNHCLHMYYGI